MFFSKSKEIIYNNRLFENVDRKLIKLNIRSRNFIKIGSDRFVYQVGDDSDSVYLIVSGQVRLKIYEDFKSSRIQTVAENDFFGELEILSKIPRKSSAVTAEKSILYKLTAEEFENIIKDSTILNNLNLDAASIPNNLKIDKIYSEESFISKDVEFSELDDSSSRNSSSLNSIELKNEDDDEDLSWNSVNIDEFEETIAEADLPADDVENFSNDDKRSSYQTEELDFSYPPNAEETMEESGYIDDPAERIRKSETNKNSIIDLIRKDLINEFDYPENELTTEEKDALADNIISSNENYDEDKLKDRQMAVVENELSEKIKDHSLPSFDEPAVKASDLISRKTIQNIYNEVQDPINIIKKYAQFLLEKSSSNEASKILKKIVDQSNYILNTLRIHTSYLDENLELRPQILQASNVLDDLLHLLAGYTEFRNVRLYRKFEADASINVDKNLLYQSFLQIVKYFCEHLLEGGNIFVTLNRTKNLILVEFRSSEAEISDDQLTKLFEPLAFVNSPGLELANRIILKHDGKITAKNIDDGGSEITVSLPIVQ